MAQVTLSVEADATTWASPAYGAGAGNHLPIGVWSGYDYRSAMRFPLPAGFAGFTSITNAVLNFYISDHAHVGVRDSAIYIRRQNIPYLWTKGAGSSTCESMSAGNNTQYDDLQNVSTGQYSFQSGSTANAKKSVNVTGIVRFYHDNGATKLVFVFDNVGGSDYTELWSDERSGYDATLVIDYETNTPPNAPTLNSPVGGTVVLSQNPTLNFTPSDPQGDAAVAYRYQVALDAGFASLYEDVTVPGSFPNGAGVSRVVTNTLTRGTTYYWRVQTSDASGYGLWSGGQSFTVQANPVTTIDPTRYMEFVDGAPRVRVRWSVSGGTQATYQVQVPGYYDSGPLSGPATDLLLYSLPLVNGAGFPVTVTVTTTDGLSDADTKSFTPRWGLTTHRRDLGSVPAGWGTPSVASSVPAGASLVVEYGSSATATAAPSPATWYSSLSSVPKARYVFWRAWFIPAATVGPTLDAVTIPASFLAALVDDWYLDLAPVVRDGDLLNGIGSFEDPALTGWAVPVGGQVTSYADASAPLGSRVLRITGDNVTAYPQVQVYVPCVPGGVYRLSAYLGMWASSGDIFVRVDAYNGNAEVMASAMLLSRSGAGTNSYQYQEYYYQAPANVNRLLVLVFIGANPSIAGQDARFDNVRIDGPMPGRVPIVPPVSIDAGEYVYGTRSLTIAGDGAVHTVFSERLRVRAGRSYVLTGLMKSQGNSGAYIRLIDAARVGMKSPDGADIMTDTLSATRDWFEASQLDVYRYKTPVFVAPADMDVFVTCVMNGAAGTAAWFDGIKLEESTVATPWGPSAIGAVTIDAGGVQVDGTKGGVFRYRGTAGGIREVVEGGKLGLLFGGDTELWSPSAGVIRGAEPVGVTSFYTDPVEGEMVYRSDLGLWMRYVAPSWVGAVQRTPLAIQTQIAPTAVADQWMYGVCGWMGVVNAIVYRVSLFFYVAGANDASNRYDFTATVAGSARATASTSGAASSVWTQRDMDFADWTPGGHVIAEVATHKVGVPGPVYVVAYAYWAPIT